MLFEVVLSFERLAADLAGERDVVLVTALVNHEVVGFGEPSLAVLAHKVDRTFGSHFLPTTKFPAVALRLHWHNREHVGDYCARRFETLIQHFSPLNSHTLRPVGISKFHFLLPMQFARLPRIENF